MADESDGPSDAGLYGLYQPTHSGAHSRPPPLSLTMYRPAAAGGAAYGATSPTPAAAYLAVPTTPRAANGVRVHPIDSPYQPIDAPASGSGAGAGSGTFSPTAFYYTAPPPEPFTIEFGDVIAPAAGATDSKHSAMAASGTASASAAASATAAAPKEPPAVLVARASATDNPLEFVDEPSPLPSPTTASAAAAAAAPQELSVEPARDSASVTGANSPGPSSGSGSGSGGAGLGGFAFASAEAIREFCAAPTADTLASYHATAFQVSAAFNAKTETIHFADSVAAALAAAGDRGGSLTAGSLRAALVHAKLKHKSSIDSTTATAASGSGVETKREALPSTTSSNASASAASAAPPDSPALRPGAVSPSPSSSSSASGAPSSSASSSSAALLAASLGSPAHRQALVAASHQSNDFVGPLSYGVQIRALYLYVLAGSATHSLSHTVLPLTRSVSNAANASTTNAWLDSKAAVPLLSPVVAPAAAAATAAMGGHSGADGGGSPSAVHSLGHDFAWNDAFQRSLDLPERTSEEVLLKYRTLSELSSDFIAIAQNYGRTIISEYRLPLRDKTLKPLSIGGVAGGTKFVARGIYFKLCEDARIAPGAHLYSGTGSGSYELAQKAGGHELRTALQYFRYYRSGLRVPMQALVEYLGFKLIAMPCLPLQTLVWGSNDGGAHVLNSDERFNALMRTAAQDLHLAPHRVGRVLPGPIPPPAPVAAAAASHAAVATPPGAPAASAPAPTLLWSAGDCEGHIGADNRFYVLDLSRGMPPESPYETIHLPLFPQSVFCRLLRPELLQLLKHHRLPPLSPDALSGWGGGAGTPGSEPAYHNWNVRYATHLLVTKVIPSFASELLGLGTTLDAAKFVPPNADGTASPLPPVSSEPLNAGTANARWRTVAEFRPRIAEELHRRGINCRHLGLLRCYLLRIASTVLVPTAPPAPTAPTELPVEELPPSRPRADTPPHTGPAAPVAPPLHHASVGGDIKTPISVAPPAVAPRALPRFDAPPSGPPAATATPAVPAAPSAPAAPSELLPPRRPVRPAATRKPSAGGAVVGTAALTAEGAGSFNTPIPPPSSSNGAGGSHAPYNPFDAATVEPEWTPLERLLRKARALSAVLLSEMVGRTLKNLLRETLRRTQEHVQSDLACKRVVCQFLNRVDGYDSQLAKAFYRDSVVPGVVQRFGSCAFSDATAPGGAIGPRADFATATITDALFGTTLASGVTQAPVSPALHNSTERTALFEYLCTHGSIVDAIFTCLNGCGVELTRAAADSFTRSPVSYAFTVADIVLSTRIKHMSVIDFAEGMVLAHEGAAALHKGVLSAKFTNSADRLLERALPRFEAALRADPSHRDAQIQSAICAARLSASQFESAEEFADSDRVLLTAMRTALRMPPYRPGPGVPSAALVSFANAMPAIDLKELLVMLNANPATASTVATGASVSAAASPPPVRAASVVAAAQPLGMAAVTFTRFVAATLIHDAFALWRLRRERAHFPGRDAFAGASSEHALLDATEMVLAHLPERRDELVSRLMDGIPPMPPVDAVADPTASAVAGAASATATAVTIASAPAVVTTAGMTPLHFCAQKHWGARLRALHMCGAVVCSDLNAANRLELHHTPLHYAALARYPLPKQTKLARADTLVTLLSLGADTTRKNQAGLTPQQLIDSNSTGPSLHEFLRRARIDRP